LCTDQDNLCAPVILLNCWSQKRAMPRISCHCWSQKGKTTLFGPMCTMIQQASQFFLNFYLCPNFFDPRLTRPKLFQTERTRRLACLPSFCELVRNVVVEFNVHSLEPQSSGCRQEVGKRLWLQRSASWAKCCRQCDPAWCILSASQSSLAGYFPFCSNPSPNTLLRRALVAVRRAPALVNPQVPPK